MTMSGKGVLRVLGAAVLVGMQFLAAGCASHRVRSEFIDPIESAHGFDAWCNGARPGPGEWFE